jgi:ABC-type lipoprotein release transport system permease subunit
MQNRFNLLLIFLHKHRKNHLVVFLISSFLLFVVASVLFLSSSIQKELEISLSTQADIIVQKYLGGNLVNTPAEWVDEFWELQGVRSVEGRVYGTYYYEPKEHHFLIVGIDFYDDENLAYIKRITNNFDSDQFLSKKQMLIGSGVKKFFEKYAYNDYYIFRPPDRSKQKVYIYNTFVDTTKAFSNDMIIVDIQTAKTILGIASNEVKDIAIRINNQDELQTLYNKLIMAHFDTRIITKDELQRYFLSIFNYKGGVFLSLYIVVIITFMLLLYQRYSQVNRYDKKEIAILRLVGWSVNELIWLKIIENLLIVVWAYCLGVVAAIINVYYFDAPLLRDIFLGNQNLSNESYFIPAIDIASLSLLFFLFVIPFVFAILIPLWRVSNSEISETFQ